LILAIDRAGLLEADAEPAWTELRGQGMLLAVDADLEIGGVALDADAYLEGGGCRLTETE
jgi:hypothetical protein